jgi:propanol-preferring alcohol dehydrogenase
VDVRAALMSTPTPVAERPLSLLEMDDPVPEPGDVVIEVIACGVCRTDLQLCEGDLEAQVLPIVPGHQIVGTVIGPGPAPPGFDVGDRVGVAWIASTCGTCRFCRAGRENLCESARFTGWDRHGGFAERVTARAEFVYRLPAGLDPVHAAPLLCGGAIGLRALRISGVAPGQRLGLYGFGASATCAIQIARHWGCEVHVCTRSVEEQERATGLGAAWTGSYDERPPRPLDAAVTFAPSGDVVISALRAVDRGGVVAINAIHLDRIPEFDYADLWWERQIRSVANVTRADVRELIDLAASIPIRTTVQEYRLEQANTALADLASGRIHGAAVVRPDRS